MISRICCALLMTACATARPLGVEQHERAAEANERAAASERRQYDPSRTAFVNECPFAGSKHESPCWTLDQNPTAIHLQEAERHMRAAEAHRRASIQLREAEARACTGLSDHDRDTTPFSHRDDVIAAEPLREDSGDRTRELGAVFTFRDVRGLTTERLQKLIDCHVARNAALGFSQDEPDDPLDMPGVTARVHQGLRVEVVANVQKTAREIQARATRLTAR